MRDGLSPRAGRGEGKTMLPAMVMVLSNYCPSFRGARSANYDAQLRI
jgi:hypothetical protein